MAERLGRMDDDEIPACRECGAPWMPYWGHRRDCSLGQWLFGEVLAMQVRRPEPFVVPTIV